MNKLRMFWDSLRSTLWFVPALIVAGAVGLALAMIELDVVIDRKLLTGAMPRVFGAGAEGSRGLLAAIAGSMITVAGVTFSITVVALTLASSQYTSRILRNFMRDRANQTVLGVFVGVFAYCLVVLRTVRSGGEEESPFVPSLAVLVALVLAFVAIGHLIYFIHHIASSIQATSIIQAVALETIEAVDRLFPEEIGEAADADDVREMEASNQRWTAVPSCATGYIQGIDSDALFALACEHDLIVRMERAIGEFVIEDAAIVSVTLPVVDDALERRINEAFVIGRDRTVHQDAAYGIRQIVDVALKALSPGVNDTTTAINSIDHLGAILARVATRQIESRFRTDDNEQAGRIIARGPTFDSLLCEAIDQIRQNADGNVAVMRRLLEVLQVVAGRTTDASRRAAIRQQADLIVQTSERSVPLERDRESVQAARAAIM